MRNEDLARYVALPHRVDLYFSEEDEAWICRYPELPGCVGHGDTPEAALGHGQEMKELWIETALEHNDTIPRPQPEPEYSGKLVLRLPKRLHERAARMAALDNVSLNHFISMAVAETVAGGMHAHTQFIVVHSSVWNEPTRLSGIPAFRGWEETTQALATYGNARTSQMRAE